MDANTRALVRPVMAAWLVWTAVFLGFSVFACARDAAYFEPTNAANLWLPRGLRIWRAVTPSMRRPVASLVVVLGLVGLSYLPVFLGLRKRTARRAYGLAAGCALLAAGLVELLQLAPWAMLNSTFGPGSEFTPSSEYELARSGLFWLALPLAVGLTLLAAGWLRFAWIQSRHSRSSKAQEELARALVVASGPVLALWGGLLALGLGEMPTPSTSLQVPTPLALFLTLLALGVILVLLLRAWLLPAHTPGWKEGPGALPGATEPPA